MTDSWKHVVFIIAVGILNIILMGVGIIEWFLTLGHSIRLIKLIDVINEWFDFQL